MATVVAVGVSDQGERQILGAGVGPSEDEAFWTAFLRQPVRRGLRGVRLVVTAAHSGLKAAAREGAPRVSTGEALWTSQSCMVRTATDSAAPGRRPHW